MGRKLHFYHLSKAKKYLSEKPSLDELIHYSSFIDDGISFHQRLEQLTAVILRINYIGMLNNMTILKQSKTNSC